jgi:hypothetical protein
MNRTTATCIAGMRSKTTSMIRIHFQGRLDFRFFGFGLGIFAKRLRWRPSATRRDDGQLGARDRPRVALCRRLFGNDPEPTGTTAVATNAGNAKLFVELGAGSLAVGIVLVVLIPFLRKLITDKAETPLIEAATVVPVA